MLKTLQKPESSPEIRWILPNRSLSIRLLTTLLFLFPGLLQAQEKLPLKLLFSGLEGAVAIDRSPMGELFILEADRHRILKTDSLGKSIERFGSRGDGLQQFDQPSDIEVTNGMRLYVADPGNQRIQLLDRRFNHVASMSFEGARTQRSTPLRATKIAVSKEGYLFAYNAVDHTIYRFDSYGRPDPAFNLELSATVTELNTFHLSANTLWVADPEQAVIHRYSLTGQYLNFVGGFDHLIAMEDTPDAAWLLTRQTLLRCDLSLKHCQSLSLPEKDYIDLAIVGPRIYLLTSQSLYTLTLK